MLLFLFLLNVFRKVRGFENWGISNSRCRIMNVRVGDNKVVYRLDAKAM